MNRSVSGSGSKKMVRLLWVAFGEEFAHLSHKAFGHRMGLARLAIGKITNPKRSTTIHSFATTHTCMQRMQFGPCGPLHSHKILLERTRLSRLMLIMTPIIITAASFSVKMVLHHVSKRDKKKTSTRARLCVSKPFEWFLLRSFIFGMNKCGSKAWPR